MKSFWLCAVPLFVAVDAIGLAPLFVALTKELDAARRRRLIFESSCTAALVAILFVWGGPALLRSLGITIADFMIAGGILLLTIALHDLFGGRRGQRWVDPESLGAVPLGVPLMTGPAVLATAILLTNLHGRWIVSVAIAANMVLAGLIFAVAEPFTHALGRTGVKIISKLASMLLAAIAVMLIRKGVAEFIVSLGIGGSQ